MTLPCPSEMRSTNTSDLCPYLEGAAEPESQLLGLDRQHEEAWFLGLRMNRGVDLADIESEFGPEPAAHARAVVQRLAADGLLESDGRLVRLTPQGRLLSNDVFQEFLDLEPVLR